MLSPPSGVKALLPSLSAPWLLLILLFACGSAAEAETRGTRVAKRRLKVLVYSPSLSWSHSQFLGRLADTLQAAGHEVHFLKLLSVSDPTLRGKNETRLVHRVHLVETKVGNAALDEDRFEMIRKAYAGSWKKLNFLGEHPMDMFADFLSTTCRTLIDHPEVLERLARERFDVGLAEMYDPCSAAIFHRIGVQAKVGALACPTWASMARHNGIPTFPSFVPNMVTPHDHDSLWSRALNFYNEFYDWAWHDQLVYRLEGPIIRRAFGAEFPGLLQLFRSVSLVFLNSNPFLELPRPTSNKLIHIGGIMEQQQRQREEQKPTLDERTKQILDNAGARGGAVLFSYGSIADTRHMGVQMRRAILGAFAQFPDVQFLWKLDSDSAQNESARLAALPNVHHFDWVPQAAILEHPNLRAFISHCGQNSLTEAARAGVPLIGIPLFGEQRYNAMVAVHRGIGLHLDIQELNGPAGEQTLVQALKKLLHEPSSYAQNAQLVRRKIAQTPFSPVDRFVGWVEFAAEFPAAADGGLDELNLPGDGQIHWFVYYSLDVIFATVATALALVWAAWKVVSTITRKLIFNLPTLVVKFADVFVRQKMKQT